MSVTILSLKNLSFNRNEKPVFDPIDLEINEGDLVHIKGANGSGKTTLAMAILRLIKPPGKITQGEIYFNNEDIIKLTSNDLRLKRLNPQLRSQRNLRIFKVSTKFFSQI